MGLRHTKIMLIFDLAKYSQRNFTLQRIFLKIASISTDLTAYFSISHFKAVFTRFLAQDISFIISAAKTAVNGLKIRHSANSSGVAGDRSSFNSRCAPDTTARQ